MMNIIAPAFGTNQAIRKFKLYQISDPMALLTP